jgi:hypothetical protein
MLNHADFKYFNDKQTVAVPKETVSISSVISLKKHESVAYAPQQVEVWLESLYSNFPNLAFYWVYKIRMVFA